MTYRRATTATIPDEDARPRTKLQVEVTVPQGNEVEFADALFALLSRFDGTGALWSAHTTNPRVEG